MPNTPKTILEECPLPDGWVWNENEHHVGGIRKHGAEIDDDDSWFAWTREEIKGWVVRSFPNTEGVVFPTEEESFRFLYAQLLFGEKIK